MEKTWPDELTDRAQDKIMALDMELQQMGREGLLSPSRYQKRVLRLKKMQVQLNQLRYRKALRQASPVREASCWADIPPLRYRSPEESVICLRYLQESVHQLQFLVSECNLTGKLVRQSVQGRWFEILSKLDLSKIRHQLSKITKKQRNLEIKKKYWSDYIEKVRKSLKIGSTLTNQRSFSVSFRHRYFEAERQNREILRLRHQYEKMHDELDLMENWLSFQEWKLIRSQTPGDRDLVPRRRPQ